MGPLKPEADKAMMIDEFKPGQRVRIVQTIDRRDEDWHSEVVGVIEKIGLEQTGSWYAHSAGDKYWLQRVRLRKDDGELTTVVVDPNTEIELLGAAR